eukprot:s2357_g15.t1
MSFSFTLLSGSSSDKSQRGSRAFFSSLVNAMTKAVYYKLWACGLALPHGLSMPRPQAFAVVVGLQFPLPALVFPKVFLPLPLHVVADVMAESCLFEFGFEP